jgi:hypothetical protein
MKRPDTDVARLAAVLLSQLMSNHHHTEDAAEQQRLCRLTP